MTGLLFANRRLAEIYDELHPDRSDLDPFFAVVDRFTPRSLLDVGCGTGTFACRLAARGVAVTALDPAAASIDVARAKDVDGRVRWIVGDATTLPLGGVDMITMTGNVGEHLDDAAWASALASCRAALRPGGHLVFGARDPAGRPWREWNAESTFERNEIPGRGAVRHWLEITDEGPRHFSFRWTFEFDRDATRLEWDATFTVRTRDELLNQLVSAGLETVEVDSREFLFIARRPVE